MKKSTLFLTVSIALLSACGTNEEKSKKGSWSQKDRTEFMRSCVLSARQSYQGRGEQPDSTIITTMCKCSGEIIEERYAYDESGKIAPDEIKNIMAEAAKKCLNNKQ